MIRDNAFGFAAIAAAILSIGGAIAIVQAQQPAGGAPAAGTVGKGAAPRTKGAGKSFAGSRGGSAPAMMAPSGMPGMGSAMGPMGMAVDDDPEMNELAQAEAAAANESEEIVSRLADANDAAERKRIVVELRETLAKQFDIQKQRRELELSRIEERVRKLQEQIKKRNDARETIIDRRLEQLVNDVDGLGWSAPGAEAYPSSPGGSNGRSGYVPARR